MIIIHGENNLDSANRLTEICNQFRSDGVTVNTFDQGELTVGKLRQELSPTDLFGGTSFIVIYGLLSGTKSKNKDKIVEHLKTENPANVLLYETKSVNAMSLKQFKGAQVESFKVEVNVFKFLEKIIPGNNSNLVSSYRELTSKKAEPEFIFAMITRQIRLLIQIKSSPQLIKLAPYSQKMLGFQSQKFSQDQLLTLHENLFQIEVGIKTGKSPLDLNNLLLHFLGQI